MKEFHQWVADMANSIPDASEIKKEVPDRANPPCICDHCQKWYYSSFKSDENYDYWD